eukprot:GEMP01085417.1.p1 GENE.GEMP01085417.1~~GEMP01085417.1.p1  ORF type:complete len:135 (-),score=12.66 GEMP01085417.1:7-411(-)
MLGHQAPFSCTDQQVSDAARDLCCWQYVVRFLVCMGSGLRVERDVPQVPIISVENPAVHTAHGVTPIRQEQPCGPLPMRALECSTFFVGHFCSSFISGLASLAISALIICNITHFASMVPGTSLPAYACCGARP